VFFQIRIIILFLVKSSFHYFFRDRITLRRILIRRKPSVFGGTGLIAVLFVNHTSIINTDINFNWWFFTVCSITNIIVIIF